MRYYVVNTKMNWTVVCENKEELICLFSRYNYKTARQRIKNALFDELTLNPNDKRLVYKWDKSKQDYVPRLVPREIMVLDEDGKIINVRLYEEEIFRFRDRTFGFWKKDRQNLSQFRKEPVPNIRSKAKKKVRCYRHPRTTNEKRFASAPEYKEYIRPKRNHKNLVDAWDDIPRHFDRSWKSQKIKRQWMKHLKH